MHRDLKPENILIDFPNFIDPPDNFQIYLTDLDDTQFILKIADFGLSW
jgi:serine/threonine protein kinase